MKYNYAQLNILQAAQVSCNVFSKKGALHKVIVKDDRNLCSYTPTLSYCLTLKRKVTYSFDTSVTIYQSTLHNTPE